MKIKVLFFAILLAATTSAVANEGPGLTVVSMKGSELYKVIYKGENSGRVRLNILDNQGRTLHTETFHSVDGFILPLNVRGLSTGTYTIEVTDQTGKYQEQIEISPASTLGAVHVNKLPSDDGRYLVTVANVPDESISVTIYDQFERVVFNHRAMVSGDFARVFRIENPMSRYTFEISDTRGNRKFFTFR